MDVSCTMPRMLNTVRKLSGFMAPKMMTMMASTPMICSACRRLSRARTLDDSSSLGAITTGASVVCPVMTGSPAPPGCPA